MWTHTFQAFAVVGLGFLLAHLAAEALMRRALLHAGALFVALGVLAGPYGLDLLSAAGLDPTPFAQLVLGWVGLQVGLGLSTRRDGGLVEGGVRAGTIGGLIVFVSVGGATSAACWALLSLATADAVLVGAVVGAAYVAGAPDGLRAMAARYGASGPVADAGASVARVSRVVAIALFAVAAVFMPRPTLDLFGDLAPSGWLLSEVALGMAVGLLADFFLGDEPDDRKLVLALLATSAFTTGVALHLGQSALMPNLVLGALLANFGSRQAVRHRAVTGLDQPTLYLLLIVAGWSWAPPTDVLVWALVAALLALRTVAMGYAGAVAAQALDPLQAGLRRLGLTLVGQGAPPVAIALAYVLSPEAVAPQLVLTAVLASVVLNDLWSAQATRIVLDEVGEIPTRTEAAR